jgi:hypothetical protein
MTSYFKEQIMKLNVHIIKIINNKIKFKKYPISSTYEGKHDFYLLRLAYFT